MNYQIFFAGTSAFLMVLLLVQQARFRKSYAGYASLSQALAETERKMSLAQESVGGLTRQEQAQQLALAVLHKQAEVKAKDLSSLEERGRQAQRLAQELDATAATARSGCASASGTLDRLHQTVDLKKRELHEMEVRSAHLVSLEGQTEQFTAELRSLQGGLAVAKAEQINQRRCSEAEMTKLHYLQRQAQDELATLMGRVDLYSRVDEYTRVGHFEVPAYVYDTSVRYQAEIKQVRDRQKDLISAKQAVAYAQEPQMSADKSENKRILDGQVNLMLFAFNVECDVLIGKVTPASLDRTLTQIEKKAEQLERNAATLRCGFSIDYVRLKFKECQLHYEFKLKKQAEQEEQRLIREQMKEEVRVQKQYEDAINDAEKDEIKYRRLIEKARAQLSLESEQVRALTLAKISLLEEDLRAALERGQRAQSMAEQTRRGFVYVISNIGAFGEGVYKIGLTRRLDPQERVDELSSASVPFRFDVHAMCFSEDAPALESALHKHFSDKRLNAVNMRKEFFRVSLDEIRAAVVERLGSEIDFQVTAQAEDFYESRRLLAA